ncbi:MAG TPA: hypothetical protein DDY98_02210 [Ruminococcaceae bacterium]|nr:hypothetical protein [Oscillospiraceae bacterium]
MFKKTVALLLCASVCFGFSSCGKNSNTADMTEEEKTSSEAVVEANASVDAKEPYGSFTMNDLTEHNTVDFLLNKYKTVSYLQSDANGKAKKEGYYFTYQNYPVMTEHWLYGEEAYYFSFNGNSVDYDGKNYCMRIYSGAEEEEEMKYDLNYDIAMSFDLGCDVIYDLEETADRYTFYLGSEDDNTKDLLCEVSKYDLSVQKVILNAGTSEEMVKVFRYNEKTKDFGFTDGWSEHKLRHVKIIQHLVVDGLDADGFMDVVAPYNVEVRPYGYGDYLLWADGESTKEYVYPGKDCDYTVYYTNVMG